MDEIRHLAQGWAQVIATGILAAGAIIKSWPVIDRAYRASKKWYLKDVYGRIQHLEEKMGVNIHAHVDNDVDNDVDLEAEADKWTES